MRAQWRVADADMTTRQALAAITGLSPLLCQVLINRGITDAAAAQAFLTPSLHDLHDPYRLHGMEQAVQRLITAIRQDKPHNEAKRGAEASLVTSMGRMASHTGQVITFDQMLNHEQELAPNVDKLTMDSPAPIRAGADGKYAVPQPGVVTNREF